MSLPQTVAEVLRDHVTLEYESVDRLYLNLYVPQLQSVGGVVGYLHKHHGQRFASTVALAPKSREFVQAVKDFAEREQIDVVHFKKGQRKDEVTQEYLGRFKGTEGVLYIGIAQEKARVMRTERRRNPDTGVTYPWVVSSTAMVNHVYFYCADKQAGPFFIKFCTYFPYNGKLCLNGNEYAKCQLRQRGIAFEALDNGVRCCADPEALQQICDGFDAAFIDRLARKWFDRLPHPYTPQERRAGLRYDLSILQAEFSLTQVLDRPASGRVFFEDVIRENLDLGRPSQVQLIFQRRVTRRTPGRFRTRVITTGVTPSLHVDYKHSRIKQYHKEGQALRTETTINDTYDFALGRRLSNLAALCRVGFTANRRLLHMETISHDCALGEDELQRHQRSLEFHGQRASALRFADERVQALMQALLLFTLSARGFSNRDLRGHLGALLGLDPSPMRPGRMSYDLRRLRLHGLIKRIDGAYRYHLTEHGLKVAMFYTRVYNRILRPGLAHLTPDAVSGDTTTHRRFAAITRNLDAICDEVKLVA